MSFFKLHIPSQRTCKSTIFVIKFSFLLFLLNAMQIANSVIILISSVTSSDLFSIDLSFFSLIISCQSQLFSAYFLPIFTSLGFFHSILLSSGRFTASLNFFRFIYSIILPWGWFPANHNFYSTSIGFSLGVINNIKDLPTFIEMLIFLVNPIFSLARFNTCAILQEIVHSVIWIAF